MILDVGSAGFVASVSCASLVSAASDVSDASVASSVFVSSVPSVEASSLLQARVKSAVAVATHATVSYTHLTLPTNREV